MNLHNDKRLFEQAILAVAESKKIPVPIIEKDYHITVLLRELVQRKPYFIFKGGTSLSKCYHIVNRFSEDIDLSYAGGTQRANTAIPASNSNGITVEETDLPTEGMRREINQTVMDGAVQCGYQLENPDEIFRRRHFNRFVFGYDPIFPLMKFLRSSLIVETALAICPFPVEIRNITSFIGEYVIETGMNNFCEQYNLTPFPVKVQKPERTFIDKIFALCDYWLTDKIAGHSRHLYDLYKLSAMIDITQLHELAREVRIIRSRSKMCPSAKPDCDIQKVLNIIAETNAYQSDYEKITEDLLFESLPYKKAKDVLQTIVDMKLF